MILMGKTESGRLDVNATVRHADMRGYIYSNRGVNEVVAAE